VERESDLAIAARHVAQGRIIVAHQRQRIARLKALGCAVQEHEFTLQVFVSTLETLEAHERYLRSHPRSPRDCANAS
jgi:hypothetical protein